ncbi:hypothetical protein CGCF415_v015742 [Colletotrichum fructicola]|nr:hypothetical protein CGCF415_v015742 [Colletotrichum fructicola]
MSLIRPISSELGLRNFQRDTVENAVQKLVDKAYSNERLRQKIGLQGIVTFESHTNLGKTDEALSEAMEQMSIEQDDIDAAAAASKPSNRKPRRRARGKGNRADQFCIYRTSDGRNVPALAIEYKAPHKLRRDEVVTGLESEIRPERDVINKDGEGFAFASRSLVAAVVTQLFSYMISKGIRYGYVCTGEAFVFLHIPDDPTIVYYSVRVPNLDVLDDENRLHGTAVAQVFAFILQALRAEPPPLSWHDAAAVLDTWAVELSRYDYTLVAKGVETLDLARLCHENEVYDRLHPIQGKYVPVCLGRADLALPLYYDSGVYKHVLFLSWAGVPLFDTANQAAKADINVVAQAYKEMYKLGVLHRDAELRNVLRDTVGGSIMVVDFERAEQKEKACSA